MAFGTLCAHCGYPEDLHYGDNVNDRRKYEGKKYSLKTCPCFRPDNPDIEFDAVKSKFESRGLELKFRTPLAAIQCVANLCCPDQPFTGKLALRIKTRLAQLKKGATSLLGKR